MTVPASGGPISDERHDQMLERFERAFSFVPLSLYDEVTKLAQYELRDLLDDNARLRAVLSKQEEALSESLDVLVDHWHNDSTPAANSLAQWMELSDAEYARFVEEGPSGYAAVIAARSALEEVRSDG